MWAYIICAGIWVGIIVGWLIPVIRKRIVYEIYEACGLGIYLSLIAVGWIWKAIEIPPLLYVGYALFAFAAFLVIFSFVGLRHKGKPKSGWEHTTLLIDSGVFQIVRHPLYLGTAIWTIGIMLVIQSVPSTILGLVAIFCFWMASKGEEEFNIKKFGQGYQEYMREVPRWNVFKGLGRIVNKRRKD
jgi:protein-S-isoprenylcysteine O-methyltransferase Ste14